MLEFNRNWSPDADTLVDPLRWRKKSQARITLDLFHESVPDEWIDRVFAVMALAPQHTFQVLTKRADRMRAYLSDPRTHGRWVLTYDPAWFPRDLSRVPDVFPPPPLPNVWLGVSAEDQGRAAARIPDLLATPAAVRFVSMEPLLGPVEIEHWLKLPDECERCDSGGPSGARNHTCPSGACPDDNGGASLDWVIAGGESGPGARPMHPDWARSLRDQCAAAGVAFFMKQMAKKAPIPADLLAREFPR